VIEIYSATVGRRHGHTADDRRIFSVRSIRKRMAWGVSNIRIRLEHVEQSFGGVRKSWMKGARVVVADSLNKARDWG
jgi:hypothetical protein